MNDTQDISASYVPCKAVNDNERTCWVYVLSTHMPDGSFGPVVKVGNSYSPYGRAETLQTGCPYKLDVFRIFEFRNKTMAASVERSFHVVLKKYRQSGEWYALSPIHAAHSICLSVRAATEHLSPEKVEEILDVSGVLAFEGWLKRRVAP